MSIAADILFVIAKPLVLRRQEKKAPRDAAIASSHSAAAYQQWRDRELEDQYRDNFDPASVKGKAVLDFGCGTGYLSAFAVTHGASQVLGIDLNKSDIADARRRIKKLNNKQIAFEQATDPKRINAGNEQFDIILCFDVLEHIMECENVFSEWHRVLKPDGEVYIWWQPYFHPWGHHLRTRIPLPWVHVIFSNKTLAEVCKRIYEMDDYEIRYADRDEKGNKKPGRVPDAKHLGGINMLSTRHFERLFRETGFRVSRKVALPFSGPAAVIWVSRLMLKIPFLTDFFSAAIIYKLQRKATISFLP